MWGGLNWRRIGPKGGYCFENIIPHLFLQMHLVIILKLSMSVHTFYMYDDIQFRNLIILYLQFVLQRDILRSHYARAFLSLLVYLI